MFVMDYTEGQGWHSPRIEPYHPISLDPAAMVFHYAQESFEGMKAYRTADGRVLLFRPEKNAARLQSTHKRLCIPCLLYTSGQRLLQQRGLHVLLSQRTDQRQMCIRDSRVPAERLGRTGHHAGSQSG